MMHTWNAYLNAIQTRGQKNTKEFFPEYIYRINVISHFKEIVTNNEIYKQCSILIRIYIYCNGKCLINLVWDPNSIQII